MTGDHKDTPGTTIHDRERQRGADSRDQPPKEAAERYARMAATQPTCVEGEEGRIVELLRTESGSIEERLDRRAAASIALARLADEAVDTVGVHVELLIEELRTERTRDLSSASAHLQAGSRTVTDNLVRTIGLAIGERPGIVADIENTDEYIDSISTDLEPETLRIATKALFASASELQHPAEAVELLGELLTYPDEAVQAWAAGTFGRLAGEDPDAVAPIADELRALLDRDAEPVQHNAVEALGALVGERPDAVVPAAAALRELLGHEETAIQHNAAGVLGRLAESHPDAVINAAGELDRLRDHDDEAVRRVAAAALARLVDEPPG